MQTESSVAPVGQAVDPLVVFTLSQSDPGKLRRYWQRTVYRLEAGQLVVISADRGIVPFGGAGPPGVPLANVLSCQGISDTT